MAKSMDMEQLVAAFAAMSGNTNPPPAAIPVQMEELVAAFAASLTMSGNDNQAAPPPAAAVPDQCCDNPETTSTEASEEDDDEDREPAKGEEACVLRVRFPDGRVICKNFGAGRPTVALFRYCRSVLLAGGAATRGRAFRIVRLAGGASGEVRASSSTSFRDLRMHRCTVHVVPV
jgi:hypothetical protein